jgi:hypothetical protein
MPDGAASLGYSRRMTRHIFRVALVVLAAALAFTAVASAAPKQGVWLAKLASQRNFGEQSGIFRVAAGPSIQRSKFLRFIIVPVGAKCGGTTNVAKEKIPIRNGRFSFVGSVPINPGGSPTYKGKLTWTGRFTTRRKVKGTVRLRSPVTPQQTSTGTKYRKKKCDSGTLRWNGRWDSRA